MMSNKERVEGILKDNPQGLTIEEISAKANLTRQTIAVIIAGFEGANQIITRKVGSAKLCSWNWEVEK